MAMFTFCNGIYAIIIQRGDFMKRHLVKKITCALAAAVMMIACAMPAFAREIDTTKAYLEINNAPEGTAMIEILVPAAHAGDSLCETQDFTVKKETSRYKTVQRYYNLTDKENQDIVIGKDSEIAQYNDDDGYFSICAHTDSVKEIKLYVSTYDDDESKTERKCLLYLQDSAKNGKPSVDIKELEKMFGKFKAAYIDEKGNILGVTEVFEVAYADEDYAFKADGNKLTLVMNNYAETVKSTLLVNFGFPVIIFIAVLVTVFIVALVLFILASQKDKEKMQDEEL